MENVPFLALSYILIKSDSFHFAHVQDVQAV